MTSSHDIIGQFKTSLGNSKLLRTGFCLKQASLLLIMSGTSMSYHHDRGDKRSCFLISVWLLELAASVRPL
jgi:hypothetical protein